MPPGHGALEEGQSSGSTGTPVSFLRTGVTQLFWNALTLREHLRQERDFSGKSAAIRIKVKEARATFYAGLITARLQYQAEIVWPVAHMTKRKILDFLPPEVVEMASFCRNPAELGNGRFRPCGTCISCNTRKEAGRFPGDVP